MKAQLTAFLAILASSSVWAHIPTYFNHNDKTHYTDPYRNIERDGDNLEQILLDHMSKAHDRLWVAVQEIRLPSIAKLLADKAKDGVDVRVVIENTYNFNLHKLSFKDAEDGTGYAGTRVLDYFRFIDENQDEKLSEDESLDRDAMYILAKGKVPLIDDTADGTVGAGLMHHKFVIIDNSDLIVTSANFTMSDIHGDFTAPDTRGNANALMDFANKDMNAYFAEEFGYLWGDGPGHKKDSRFGTNKPYRAPKTFTLKDGETVTVQFSATKPSADVADTTQLMVDTLSAATKSIDFALFVFSDQRLSNAMKSAYDSHHVEIRGMVEPSFAYRYYSELLDMWGLQMKNAKCGYEQGNVLWPHPLTTVGTSGLPKGDFLHHKFATVDHRKIIFGSHNWSESAAHINDETLLVVDSPESAGLFEDEIDRLMDKAVLGVPSWVTSKVQSGTCDTGSDSGEDGADFLEAR